MKSDQVIHFISYTYLFYSVFDLRSDISQWRHAQFKSFFFVFASNFSIQLRIFILLAFFLTRDNSFLSKSICDMYTHANPIRISIEIEWVENIFAFNAAVWMHTHIIRLGWRMNQNLYIFSMIFIFLPDSLSYSPPTLYLYNQNSFCVPDFCLKCTSVSVYIVIIWTTLPHQHPSCRCHRLRLLFFAFVYYSLVCTLPTYTAA